MKDPKTGSVVNVDNEGFRQAKAAKKRILESKTKVDELEERLKALESAIELLKGQKDG